MAAALPATRQVDRHDCLYTSCYCEENVWLLSEKLLSSGAVLDTLYAVFVSNQGKQVPMWRQRSSSVVNGVVVWDYHVLLLQKRPNGTTIVWDLDSTLPFPCPLEEYVTEALQHRNFALPPDLTRLYRVIPAASFLHHFASDRSHMRDGEGGWQQPPPPYPCIMNAEGGTHTLPQFLEMPPLQGACSSANEGEVMIRQGRYGAVLTESAFLSFFECG